MTFLVSEVTATLSTSVESAVLPCMDFELPWSPEEVLPDEASQATASTIDTTTIAWSGRFLLMNGPLLSEVMHQICVSHPILARDPEHPVRKANQQERAL